MKSIARSKYLVAAIALVGAGLFYLLAHPNVFSVALTPPPTPTSTADTAAATSTPPPANPGDQPKTAPPAALSSIQIGATKIPVEIARSPVARQKGLSGRASLDQDKGMLFIFLSSAIYRFWMPDMHFNLDMIWINNGKVVDITYNASKVFDPANPKFYSPSKPARYVLEVNAGFAHNKNIAVGDPVIFYDIQ